MLILMINHALESRGIVSNSFLIFFLSNRSSFSSFCFAVLYNYIGMWVQHVWDTTHVLYKEILKKWYKGTGGGSGESTLFEGWSDEKLQRHDIDPDTYDHTNIASRPAVLMEGYCPQKIPFLTVIFLWDKNVDFLLSSRHDPLNIGQGDGKQQKW